MNPYYRLWQEKHDPAPTGWEKCDRDSAISALASFLQILVMPPTLAAPAFLNINDDARGVHVLRLTTGDIATAQFEITTPGADTLTVVWDDPAKALDVAAGFLVPTMLWLDQQIAKAKEDERRHDLSCFLEGQADAQGRIEAFEIVKAHLIYEQLRDGERGQDEDYKERRALDPN